MVQRRPRWSRSILCCACMPSRRRAPSGMRSTTKWAAGRRGPGLPPPASSVSTASICALVAAHRVARSPSTGASPWAGGSACRRPSLTALPRPSQIAARQPTRRLPGPSTAEILWSSATVPALPCWRRCIACIAALTLFWNCERFTARRASCTRRPPASWPVCWRATSPRARSTCCCSCSVASARRASRPTFASRWRPRAAIVGRCSASVPPPTAGRSAPGSLAAGRGLALPGARWCLLAAGCLEAAPVEHRQLRAAKFAE